MASRVFAVNGTVSIRNELFELQFRMLQPVSHLTNARDHFLHLLIYCFRSMLMFLLAYNLFFQLPHNLCIS